MNIEQALKTAIEFEHKVRDNYRDAMGSTSDEKGKKIFKTMVDEEQGHVDYLQSRLHEWQKTGKVTAIALATAIPARAKIEAGLRRLKAPMQKVDRTQELEVVKRLLDTEVAAGDFYRRMVEELPKEHQPLFQRFMEIEDGHAAIVQAQLDTLTGMGYWFDFMEFNLEAG